MTLRQRILLAVAPLLVLIAGLGGAGAVLLVRLGHRSDAILRENYDSVRAMDRLAEAVGQVDRALLTGDRREFDAGWAEADRQCAVERANVTVYPDEPRLLAELEADLRLYRAAGELFFTLPPEARPRLVVGTGPGAAAVAPADLRRAVLDRAAAVRDLNERQLRAAARDAQAAARASVGAVVGGVLGSLAVAVAAAWGLQRVILGPIRAVTAAAQGVAESGRFELVLPVAGGDELGRLAAAFNAMTRQLREYRRSNLSQLLRARRTAQATIDSFPDPVLVLDPESRVELANPAALRVLGAAAPAADVPGPVWQPPAPLAEPVRAAVHGRREAVAESFDQAVTFRVGGEDRSFLPQVRPIRDPGGEPLGAAVVLHDVTRFRLLDQLKTDLVATVSHELKTPLTAVRLAVHVLLEEAVGPLTSKQADLLVDARDNAERLLALIEQLLALARLQRPEAGVRRERADPAALLRRAADAVRGRADDKHVAVEVRAADPLPAVEVDPERIGLALRNLLDNAIAYTPAGGTVALGAAAAPGGRVELSVSDTGVGIPAEYQPHVFERFFRVPGQSDPAGTGLGLAIVKEVVTAHGGAVACESEPGRGTTFRLSLPARPAAVGEIGG